jgi:predicted esterase
MIAAIAPVAAADAKHNAHALFEGFEPFDPPLERARDIPIWAFHGARDEIVPLTAAQQTVDDFVNVGADVRFTIYEENDHDAWSDTYTNPELYEWFLQHSR